MRLSLIAACLAGALLVTACAETPTPLPVDADIVVVAAEFGFTPPAIEVIAGQRVRITLRNKGKLEHDFSIETFPMEILSTPDPVARPTEAGLPQFHLAADPGQSASLEFTPTQPGTYQIFCSVPGHIQAGMNGILVVKAP